MASCEAMLAMSGAFQASDKNGSFALKTGKHHEGGRADLDAHATRLQLDQAVGSLFDAVPFTPSQGVCGSGSHAMSQTMFSPFSSFQRGVDPGALGLVTSDGSSGSDASAIGMPPSPGTAGMTGYSPFMGAPWGHSLYNADGTAGPTPLELPNSPMSPGIVFNPSPSPAGAIGAPSSPRSLFQGQGAAAAFGLNAGLRTTSGSLHLPSSFSGNPNTTSAAADAAAAATAAATAALNSGLPPFYFQAAAAAVGGAGGTSPLQAALNQTLLNQHTASLAAAQQQQQQQQLLQASLSAALANQAAAAAAANPFLQGYNANLLSALEPMRSGGGSLSLDGGLQQQASVNAAAALLQQQQQQMAAVMAAQQHHVAASQLRRNMSTPAGVAAQLGLSSAAAAASASLGLTAASALSGSGLPLSAQMGRLHVTHSADLSHLDTSALLGGPGGNGSMGSRPKFNKARKNSEPKIGPDGQPRLNARQRRTLRRAKERALKGLLEVSQALLQKAEVQVTVPNISHLTALEELAAVEAEKEAASGEAGDGSCLSPGSAGMRASNSGGRSSSGSGTTGRGVTRSQQLAAAAAAVEESVCEIARAAVAAVTAQATGKDTSSAAAAAQAAAAQAASAAASAGAVLPPGFVMPEADEGGSEELQGCNSGSLDGLAHSAPTSPVGSMATSDPSSGRSSSSSSSSLPGSARCSSSSTASVTSSYGSAAKPPMCQHPPRPASTTAVTGPGSSPLCSPLPSPTPSCGGAVSVSSTPAGPKAGSQLEGIDIAGLIGQLSLKKDEGMVDDKLIRDLQIIQSLIGALKAPAASVGSMDCGSGLQPGGSNIGSCSSLSPVPGGHGRHLRGVGAKSMPSKRCNSPSTGGIPLHSL